MKVLNEDVQWVGWLDLGKRPAVFNSRIFSAYCCRVCWGWMSAEENVPVGFFAIMSVKIKASLFMKSVKSTESVGCPFIFFPQQCCLNNFFWLYFHYLPTYQIFYWTLPFPPSSAQSCVPASMVLLPQTLFSSSRNSLQSCGLKSTSCVVNGRCRWYSCNLNLSH